MSPRGLAEHFLRKYGFFAASPGLGTSSLCNICTFCGRYTTTSAEVKITSAQSFLPRGALTLLLHSVLCEQTRLVLENWPKDF